VKIRELTPDNYPKASALLRQAFPRSTHEVQLVENLHKNNKPMHEWVCIHINAVIAYIAFSRAYNGSAVCPAAGGNQDKHHLCSRRSPLLSEIRLCTLHHADLPL